MQIGIQIQTQLHADHPTVRLTTKLDELIAAERVTNDVALSALASLVAIVGKGGTREDAILALKGLQHAASLIASKHFPEWQFDAANTPH